MKRNLLGLLVAGLLSLGLAPAVLAQDGMEDVGHVLVSINGSVDQAAGESADVLVVVNGDAQAAGASRTVVVVNGDAELTGTAETLVVVNGNATLTDAKVETVVVASGTATIGPGTQVTGDVRTLNGTATVDPAASVAGEVSDLGPQLATLGIILVPALLLVGAALVTVVVALFVAALAARQVRQAEWLISNEPGPSLLFGLLGMFVLPLLAILALVTVVGAPVGLVFLFSVLPTVAYLGWIVAAIWVGDWVLGRTRSGEPAERPYLASVIGVILLGAGALIPIVGSIVGFVASLFGIGSLLLLGWRTFRREPVVVASSAPVAPPAA
jgi:hypothetical protein